MISKIFNFLKKPSKICLLLIFVISCACLVLTTVLVFKIDNSVVPLTGYSVGGLLMGYFVTIIVVDVLKNKEKIRKRIVQTKIGYLLLENYSFRTIFFSLCSLNINLGFILLNLLGAIWYTSVWYSSLVGYYSLLIIFRAGIVFLARKINKKHLMNPRARRLSQLHVYLGSGIFLFFLEIAMIISVTQMVTSNESNPTNIVMAITTALYAFYKMTLSIYNLVKAKRFNNPIIQSLRNLNFADACMSMVSLTVVLISTFGTQEDNFLKWGAGFAACATVIACALVVIIRTCIKLKEEQNGREQ